MDKNKIRIPFTPPHALARLPGDSPILLALSGGADSRALLHLLAEHREKTGAPLFAAHVDHGIRGEEAARDRDFCLRTAGEYNIPCFILEADVPALAREHKESLETEARRVRYEFFEKLMREHAIPLLATAHNSDDCLETLIFNLARGSGLGGLASIPPAREFGGGYLVRPLIAASKKEILAYCAENGLEHVTDSTNSDTTYSRNLIRHKIIPALEEVNPGARENAARLSAAARDAGEFIGGEAEKFLSRFPGRRVPARELASLPPALLHAALSRLCRDTSGVVPEKAHIDALAALIWSAKEGSALSLPGLIRAKISGGLLVFGPDPRKKEIPPSALFSVNLEPGVNTLPGGVIILGEPGEYIKERESLTFVSDIRLDPALLPLCARSMAEGDTIICRGMTKRVRKLLSEKKLPAEIRRLVPIVTDGRDILWIPGIARKDGENLPLGGIPLAYYKL